MLRYNDLNQLHELCRSHAKRNVLLKFVKPSVWFPTAGLEPVTAMIERETDSSRLFSKIL